VLLTTILPSHTPRPTPGPAGSGRAQTLPRWLLPDTDSRIGKDRTGPDRDERSPPISVCHRNGRFLRTNLTFPLHSPPLTRWPFFRGQGAQPQFVQACL